MYNDLRFALRQLGKNPGFTAVAVLTLALGIGVNTAIFSVVDSVLLKPLPYERPGQLVQLWEVPSPGKRNSASPGAFLDWREHGTPFESLSLRQNTAMNLTGGGEPERLSGLAMSANGLQILRARPLLGRTFAPDEDQPGKDKVVVLSHGLWQRRFGGETNIVGRTIQLSDQGYTVIGVLPPRFLPWDKAEPRDGQTFRLHYNPLSVEGCSGLQRMTLIQRLHLRSSLPISWSNMGRLRSVQFRTTNRRFEEARSISLAGSFKATNAPRLLPLVRLSPATFHRCIRMFPLFFEVAFLKQDPDDLATGELVVPGDNVNGCLDVHEHIAHARPFLSFSVELGEVASHDVSLPGRSQL